MTVPRLLLVALAVQVIGASSALGAFSGQTVAGHTISSATLEPVSDLAGQTSCGPLLSLSAKAVLTWTATPSTFATGYTVERWKGSTLQSTAAVTPRTTTTRTETGLATGTTYTWKVYARYAGTTWTSGLVSVVGQTPGLCL